MYYNLCSASDRKQQDSAIKTSYKELLETFIYQAKESKGEERVICAGVFRLSLKGDGNKRLQSS